MLSTEMVHMVETLEAGGLSVGRCEVSRSIRVTGITSEEFKNCVPALERYFGSTKRSGGGAIDTFDLLQEGIAIITFKDHNGTDS